MTIGSRIRQLRLSRGYTLEDISKKVKISRQTLSRYETGFITNIPSDKIEEIAVALETTPAYLMGWTEPEAKQPNGDVMALRERLRRQPSTRMLLDATEDATEAEIMAYVDFINTMKKIHDDE